MKNSGRNAVFAQSSSASCEFLEFSEEETRLKLIDAQLRSVGWGVGENLQSTTEVGREVEVEEQPTETGIGKAERPLGKRWQTPSRRKPRNRS